jgi:hypothetical protein
VNDNTNNNKNKKTQEELNYIQFEKFINKRNLKISVIHYKNI